MASDDSDDIGGIKAGKKPYRLPEDQRKEMKDRIAELE